MVTMAIQGQVGVRESIERKPWTSEAWRDVLGFLAQSLGLVCAAVFLYSLGPALGMTLFAVSLGVWLFLGSQTASAEEEDEVGEGEVEDSRLLAGVDPSRWADPLGLRSSRLGIPAVSAARPVQRQGA